MYKRLLLCSLLVICIGVFGCERVCEHAFCDATCDNPSFCEKCGEIGVSAKGHNWDEGLTIREATEETEGEVLYTCKDCNNTKIQLIGVLEHIHGFTPNTTHPTCTEMGYTTYTCRCGYSYINNEKPAYGHDWIEATCTTAKSCRACHITDGAPLGHDWESATCSKPKTCKNCGYNEGEVSHLFYGGICKKCGERKPSEGLIFKKIGNFYEVSSIGTCKDRDIVIPTVYNNLPITSVGDKAFYGCELLTSVIIPNGITKIGNEAFSGCKRLVSVSIPNSVKSIGKGGFNNCERLTSVLIPNGIVTINSSTFSGCKQLVEIKLPSTVRYIGDWVFNDCHSLQGVNIPNGVANVGEYTFNNCRNLKNVYIPNSVKSIGAWAFNSCGIVSVSIPDNVSLIGAAAFSSCHNLQSVTFGKNSRLTTIGNGAFSGCYSLGKIEIPSGVMIISLQAFKSCWGMTEIKLPDGLTIIDDNAFWFCWGITSIVIPDSVNEIANEAFSGCTKLEKIVFEGTVEQWNSICLGDLWNERVPALKVVCSDGIVELN